MAKSAPSKKMQTVKTGKEVALPQQQDVVFVANRVIEASYNYSLIQEKVFNFLLWELQQAIKLNMNNQDYKQLDLFKPKNSTAAIRVQILLRNLATPNNFKKVREAAAVMGKEQIRIKILDEKGKPATRIVQLFVAVETPDQGTRDSYLKIDMSAEVAQILIDMDKREDGKAINYTSFILQVATGSVTNKYTPRIYKLISSWKNKTGFYQSLEEFRKWLGLTDEYKSFAELKRNVLIPVQKDLEGKSDCWFNCAEKDFFRKEGNAVVGINWKVIKPELEEKTRILKDNIRNMLKMHFFLQEEDFAALGHLFGPNFDYEKLTMRLFELRKYISENSSKIKNKRHYVLASLSKMKSKEANSSKE